MIYPCVSHPLAESCTHLFRKGFDTPRGRAGKWARDVQIGDRVEVGGKTGTVTGYGPRRLWVRLDDWPAPPYSMPYEWSRCRPVEKP